MRLKDGFLLQFIDQSPELGRVALWFKKNQNFLGT